MRQSSKVILLLTILDLWLKYLAVRGDYAVINQGVSFGLKMGTEWLVWVLWLAFFVWLYRQKMWLVLAGGAANLVSRIVWGGVVDYLPFFGLFYNNVADYMIVGGIGIAVISSPASPAGRLSRNLNSKHEIPPLRSG